MHPTSGKFVRMLQGTLNVEKSLEIYQKDMVLRQQELLAEKERINIELDLLNCNINAISKRLKKDRIATDTDWRKRLFITDHAIVRYIERVEGRNIDLLRKGIMSCIPDVILDKAPVIRAGKTWFRLTHTDKKILLATVIVKGK